MGKAVATDRIMEEEDRLDEWLALAKLTPLTFMYRFMKSEVFEIFPAEAIEHAFNRAELLEAEFRPVVDLARLIFRLRTGSAKPGRSVGS